MDLTLIQQFIEYGIFAALFVALFVYTLKNNKDREERLIETLDKFAESVGDKLDDVCKDVEDIKADVEDIKTKIK